MTNQLKPPIMKKKKMVRKIKLRAIFAFFLLVFIILGGVLFIMKTTKIRNLYVTGNLYLSDQTVIELAGLENYPPTFENFSSAIEKKLEQNVYIREARVFKKWFTEIHLEIVENRPLFYSALSSKTVLTDGREVDKKFDVALFLNYVPDTIYQEMIEKMAKLDSDIIARISEIKYDPNDVDSKRFFLTMRDGNYVYLTLDKFENMNRYVDIIKQFNNKKGVLYLDSGEYFKILEGN